MDILGRAVVDSLQCIDHRCTASPASRAGQRRSACLRPKCCAAPFPFGIAGHHAPCRPVGSSRICVAVLRDVTVLRPPPARAGVVSLRDTAIEPSPPHRQERADAVTRQDRQQNGRVGRGALSEVRYIASAIAIWPVEAKRFRHRTDSNPPTPGRQRRRRRPAPAAPAAPSAGWSPPEHRPGNAPRQQTDEPRRSQCCTRSSP